MRNRFIRMLVVLGACTLAACQSYTTGLQKSSTRADETAAIAALHSISLAQQTYQVSNGSYGTFPQLVQAGALDERFKSEPPRVKGYVLLMNVIQRSEAAESSYTVNADPDASQSLTGRHFYLDSTTNLIRVNATQPAGASDQSLESN
jgi:Tfp pilus assembly protein PilE